MSRSTVNDYIKRMRGAELIEVKRRGRRTQCFLLNGKGLEEE
jgi:hypothetical protein